MAATLGSTSLSLHLTRGQLLKDYITYFLAVSSLGLGGILGGSGLLLGS